MQNFVVLNVSRFPMITLNQQAVVEGYATQWMDEMSRLIEQALPFVMVYDHMRAEESEADRQLRGQWLIQQRKKLSAVCRGMISIETDTQRLDELMKMRKHSNRKEMGKIRTACLRFCGDSPVKANKV